MLGTDFPKNYLPPNDGENLLKSVETILKKGDVIFGNLEGVLADTGTCTKKVKSCCF